MDKAWENAIREGDPVQVYDLIVAGADVNARDKYGQTAIMLASRSGHTDVVQLLVDAHAELNVTAKYNLSALMLAVINHHEHIVRILVDAGADLNLRGSGAPGFYNKTAAELARDSGQKEVAASLERCQIDQAKDSQYILTGATLPTASVNIRAEQPADKDAIKRIHSEAFSADVEAKLVDALRASGEPLISLVAEHGEDLVGHILFSPVTLTGDEGGLRIMGLAPMAVLPSHQRRGIGSLLVERGLKRCQEDGYDAVVVLGHANYYPRFGFRPAAEYGITCEYDVPPGAFMVKELKAACLDGHPGTIKFHAAFSDL